jgi:hypothetical protein
MISRVVLWVARCGGPSRHTAWMVLMYSTGTTVPVLVPVQFVLVLVQ